MSLGLFEALLPDARGRRRRVRRRASRGLGAVTEGPTRTRAGRIVGTGGEPMSVRSGVILALLLWLPMLALAASEGQLLRSSEVTVPFLLDFEVHARLLFALPLLIAAEQVTQERMQPLLRQFLERDLVPRDAMPRFEAAIASAYRLRNSVLAELLLVAFVYGIGLLIWREYIVLDVTTWYAVPTADGFRPCARIVLRLRRSADLPVPPAAVVLSAVHLGALFIAGLRDRAEFDRHPPGPARGPRIPARRDQGARGARDGLRRRCWPAGWRRVSSSSETG